jgi:predicted outer membrane repeat protein
MLRSFIHRVRSFANPSSSKSSLIRQQGTSLGGRSLRVEPLEERAMLSVGGIETSTFGGIAGVPAMSSITGSAFIDPNGNFTWDVGESAAEGWTVFLDLNQDNVLTTGEPSQLTASDGSYTFTDLEEGTYKLKAQWDMGLYPYGGGLGNLSTVTVGFKETVVANDIAFIPSSILRGKVWKDLNADGVVDVNEPKLSNVQVFHDTNGNGLYDVGEMTRVTTGIGAWDFGVPPGSYDIYVVPPEGMVSTTPLSVTCVAEDGNLVDNVDFGLRTPASISGTIFDDVNVNEIWDAGEGTFPHWKVFIDSNENNVFDTGETSVLTDTEGIYAFSDLLEGTYPISIEPFLWHLPTVDLPLYVATDSIADIGATKTGNASGQARVDVNADGYTGTGEPALVGWKVYDDANLNGVWDDGEEFTFIEEDSFYWLGLLLPGDHRIAIAPEADYTMTTSTYHDRNIQIGITQSTDFAAVNYASISGKLFDDLDENGVQDVGESDLEGWTVFLDEDSDGVLDGNEQSVATAADGGYVFTDLLEGTYPVAVIMPTGEWGYTVPNSPQSVSVVLGENRLGVDVGVHDKYWTITGTVYDDVNQNGDRDAGESPFTGWRVYIDTNENGAYDTGELWGYPDAEGGYFFTGLESDSYPVSLDNYLPYIPTIDLPVYVSINAPTADLGGTEGARISGQVKFDLNNDGHPGPEDPGLVGWRVYHDSNRNGVWDEGETYALTQENSWAFLGSLLPGSHRFAVTPESGYTITSATYYDRILLAGTGSSVNFSAVNYGSISGKLYDDMNENGVQDAGESDLEGWSVYLDEDADGVLDWDETSVVTAVDGSYVFPEVMQGDHLVAVQITDDEWDYTNPTGPQTVSVLFGEESPGINFGVAHKYWMITGTVYDDVNQNGVKDTGESPFTGWRVYIDTNENGTYDTGEPWDYSDAEGGYFFTGLESDTYPVSLDSYLPYIPTIDMPVYVSEGSPIADLGGTEGSHLHGQVVFDLDNDGHPGPEDPALVGWRVYHDSNRNGVWDEGETYALTQENSWAFLGSLLPGEHRVAVTPEPGYTITSPTYYDREFRAGIGMNVNFSAVNYGSISGKLYDDINEDGVQDAGESDLEGWSVYLDEDADGVLNEDETSVVTTIDGSYVFPEVMQGDHLVAVQMTDGEWDYTIPTGPQTVAVLFGEDITGIDIGVVHKYWTITGTVYDDVNLNGVMDAGESPSANRRVFIDQNQNAIFDLSETSILSDANGWYMFTGLDADSYPISFEPSPWNSPTIDLPVTVSSSSPEADLGAVPTGHVFVQAQGDLNADGFASLEEPVLVGWKVYDDTNLNGNWDEGETFALIEEDSFCFLGALYPGEHRIAIVPEAGYTMTTPSYYDMNINAKMNYYLRFMAVNYASISGKLYDDLDGDGVEEIGEPGLEGWTVFLDENSDGILDAGEKSVATAADGSYVFDDLLAGTYEVTIATPSSEWEQITPAGPQTVAVALGDHTAEVDFGARHSFWTITGTVYDDVNQDGVKDIGESPLSSWTLFIDENENGVFDEGETFTLSDANGEYAITRLSSESYPIAVKTSTFLPTTESPIIVSKDVPTADFGVTRSGSVSGQIHFDQDLDNYFDTDEQPMAGVRVYSDANMNGEWDAGEHFVLTGENGVYNLLMLPGLHTIKVSLDQNYETMPSFLSKEVTAGYGSFGDFAVVGHWDISGKLYEDINANGVQDVGEPNLSNMLVYLDINTNLSFDSGEPNQYTGSDGSYLFEGLLPNDYDVRVDVSMFEWSYISPPTPQTATVPIGSDVVDFNYGLFKRGKISGRVAIDLNSDGVAQSEEPPLLNYQAFIDLDQDGLLGDSEPRVSAQGDGEYEFPGLLYGDYQIAIAVPGDYVITSDTARDISVISGTQAIGQDFAVIGARSISGKLWDDQDESGVQEVGEPDLEGWTVYIDESGNNHFDTGEPTTQTQTDGIYVFDELTSGDYRIGIVPISTEWEQTVPSGTQMVSVAVTEDVSGVDFGAHLKPSLIQGRLGLDDDASGYISNGEYYAIAGLTLYLDDNLNNQLDAGEISTLTTSSGYFNFLDAPAGPHTIAVVFPSSTWEYTEPLSERQVTAVDHATVSAGVLCIRELPFIVTGEVWHDVDGNGLKDPGEPPIKDWIVYLDLDNDGMHDAFEVTVGEQTWPAEPYAATRTDGSYIFNLDDGTFSIRADYFSHSVLWDITTVAGYSVSGVSGDVLTGRNFGAQLRDGNVIGQVWNDLDRDGERNYGETAISNVSIYVDENQNGQHDAGEPLQVTDAEGNYRFHLLPGSWDVCAIVPDGYINISSLIQTCIVPDSVAVKNVNFGMGIPTATITGVVWNDANADGIHDASELPAGAGFTVFIDADDDNANDPEELSTTTDANGVYVISGAPLGTSKVVMYPPTTVWKQSYPVAEAAWSVTAFVESTVENIDFGAYMSGNVSGSVFYDRSNDGVQDLGEGNLWDATIYVDANDNGLLDAGEWTTSPNADTGDYSLYGLPPGDSVIRMLPRDEYTQTTPSPDLAHRVSIVSNETVTDLDFGAYAPPVSLSGHIWFDVDRDGVRDPEDLDYDAGGVISIEQGHDNQFGGSPTVPSTWITPSHYEATNLQPGDYEIHYTRPASGWVPTNPTTTGFYAYQQVTIAPGNSPDDVDFGGTFTDQYYVDANSPAGTSGNGLSWSMAYNTLADALKSAKTLNSDSDPQNDIDEIWIADGTYYPLYDFPNGSGTQGNTFEVPSNIAIYGGFQGTEATIEERDRLTDGTLAFETILSGNVGKVDISTDNAYSVVFCYQVQNVLIDGLMIQEGYASGSYSSNGITESKSSGGGVYAYDSSITLQEITFRNNYATSYGGGLRTRNATAEVIACNFLNNSAGTHGGAINSAFDTILIRDSLFENNSAYGKGGGMTNYRGDSTVQNSIFHGNSAGTAAGAARVEGNTTFENVVMVGNQSPTGAGLYVGTYSATATNCTIVANEGEGVYVNPDGGSATINNSIVAQNTEDVYGSFVSTNNLIDLLAAPVDPMFVRSPSDGGDGWGDDPATTSIDESANDDYGDLQLRLDSPALNAGDNSLLPADVKDLDGDGDFAEPLPIDLLGNARIKGGLVDLGAYESLLSTDYYITGTEGDDAIFIWPGDPGETQHRVQVNGVDHYYDAAPYDAIHIDGLAGTDALDVNGKATSEKVVFDGTSIHVSESTTYNVFGQDFENTYVFGGGGEDSATMLGSTGADNFYAKPTYTYLRGDSNAFLNYVKNFTTVTVDASNGGGLDKVYAYDSPGDDVLTAGESQATLDYDSTASPGVNITAIGFNETNAYAMSGGHDSATLIGSSGDDQFTARDLYSRMRGNGGAYIHYAEGFDQVTGDASGTTGTDIATLFDADGDDRLEAGETTAALDLDATPGIDDFDLIAHGFDQNYVYAIRGGNDTALLTGSNENDRLTSKRSYSTLKRQDGAYFNYAAGFDQVTVDVSSGGGIDLAFLYDEVTDDAFEASPSQATLDYDHIGSPGIDTTAIGFGQVYAYAEEGGNDSAILIGSANPDKYYGLATYSYFKAADDSYFNYVRGFDSVIARASGPGDLAFLYDSDGDDQLGTNGSLAVFTLNPTSGGRVINRATLFDQIYSYASNGGTDVANLMGTTEGDTFIADADWGIMKSRNTDDYFDYIRYFDEVYADPGDGQLDNDELDDRGVSYLLDADPGNGNVW